MFETDLLLLDLAGGIFLVKKIHKTDKFLWTYACLYIPYPGRPSKSESKLPASQN